MISDSASGISNGVRADSAIAPIRNSTNATKPHGWNTNHPVISPTPPLCALMMSTVESEPATITTATAANTIGTSYETTCATARIAPSSENLLRDAQPPMNNASTLAVLTANANRMPMLRLTGTSPGPTGTTANNSSDGITAMTGARKCV